MGQINLPDTQSSMYADLERRIRVLEGTARSGFGQLRFSRSIQPAPSPTVFGAWEDGTASGVQYIDNLAATGAGYGTVSCNTGKRVMIWLGCTILGVGFDASRRSRTVSYGVGLNGADPSVSVAPQMFRRHSPGWPGLAPEMTGQFYVLRDDLTPGVNTFKVWANWTNDNPAAAAPTLNDSFLLVLPLANG